MRYFGEQAHHPKWEQAPAPIGEVCVWCDEPIAAGECGYLVPSLTMARQSLDAFAAGCPAVTQPLDFTWHQECFLRQIVGSLGHQERKCSCYGGAEEDPVGFSRRQAALMAVAKFHAEHPE